MVKNWFKRICSPRRKGSGEDGNDDDNVYGKPKHNEGELLTGNVAAEVVDDDNGNSDDGSNNPPRMSPRKGKSDERGSEKDMDSKVAGKKKLGKKRIRGGGNDKKEEHGRADNGDGTRQKEKEHRKQPAVPLRQDPKYGKYFKLLDDGLPLSAIKIDIEQDGLDPTVIELCPNSSLKSQMREQRKQQQKSPKPQKKKTDLTQYSYSTASKRREKKGSGCDTRIIDGDSDDGVRDTNASKKKPKTAKRRKSSKDNENDDSRESQHKKDHEQGEQDTRGKDPISPEKDKKKKKNKKKKSKKKDEKDEEGDEDNIVDEKNLKEMLEESEIVIGSLHESLESSKEKVQDMESLNPDDLNCENASLGDVELFELLPPSPRAKKQFLEAALTARSLSDLNYVHSAQAPKASRRKSTTDLIYEDDDKSLGDDDVFELDSPIPRPKKQFLEAALTAKSISDLNYLHSAQAPEGSTSQDYNVSIRSLNDITLFELDSPNPRPKKRFLDAALRAKSFSDLNYVHSAQASKASRRKSTTDLMYEDDRSLEDDGALFELDSPIPRPKKQFLEAALTAKSISDLNYLHSARATEGSTSQDYNASNDSLDEVALFELDSPNPRPKKRFLDAAIMAKSISDLNYVHSAQAPNASRRKSTTDLMYEDDRSLEDDGALFELDSQIPRPKKQFLEAALTAKSISDLNYLHSAQATEGLTSQDYNGSNNSLDDVALFELDSPNTRPKKQFLDAAIMAKSISDLNYVHSAQAPNASRRKSLTDLKYDDDRSLGDNEVFELDTPMPRPKKQFLEAALMAKSLSDLKCMYLNSTSTTSLSLKDNESRDDTSNAENFVIESSYVFQEFSKSVPDHLAIVHQPNKALPPLDDLSIGNDRLFDSPEPERKNPLLKAALRAKEETKILQSPFSKSDLKMLKKIEHTRGDTTNDISDQIDAAERNDSDVELKGRNPEAYT
jgi:hypothetical protein